MNLTLKQPTTSLKLSPQAVHSATKIEAGTTFVCEKGIIWLTQANDVKDYLLQPGDKLVINKRNSVMLQAMSEAHVSIITPN
jgi:hypothetical protein